MAILRQFERDFIWIFKDNSWLDVIWISRGLDIMGFIAILTGFWGIWIYIYMVVCHCLCKHGELGRFKHSLQILKTGYTTNNLRFICLQTGDLHPNHVLVTWENDDKNLGLRYTVVYNVLWGPETNQEKGLLRLGWDEQLLCAWT